MNENPEGMPNPLNPNPGAEPDLAESSFGMNPPAPTPRPAQTRVVDPMMASSRRRPMHAPSPQMSGMDDMMMSDGAPDDMLMAGGAQPAPTGGMPIGNAPISSAPIGGRPVNNNPAMAETDRLMAATEQVVADPTMRPMQKAPVQEAAPPKKKKTGLIVGIIIAAVVLIGGAVTAVLLLNSNKEDAVSKAVNKIVNEEMPENIAIDGTITISSSKPSSAVSGLTIALESESATNSMINSTKAKMTINFTNGHSSAFNIEEVYASNGDLFLKFDGATDMLKNYSESSTFVEGQTVDATEGVVEATNCTNDETDDTNCIAPTIETDCETEEGCDQEPIETTGTESEDMLSLILEAFAEVFETVDGQWVKIPVSEIGQLADSTGTNGDTGCMLDFIGNIKNYGNNLKKTYLDHPFITSSTKDVTVESRQYPVRKIVFDDENYSGFITAFKNSALVRNYSTCMGEEVDNTTFDLDKLPTMYVEVNKDYDFTRLYFKTESDSATVVVDLDFTYPGNINVVGPADYIDLMSLVQEMVVDVNATEVTEETGGAEEIVDTEVTEAIEAPAE